VTDKGKKKKRPVTPAHSAAQGAMQAETPDATKAPGNPYQSPYARSLTDPPMSRNALAAGHPDLRQGRPDFSPTLPGLRTYVGDAAGRGFADQDNLMGAAFSNVGHVALHHFDARSQAGVYSGLEAENDPSGSPVRPGYGQHRDSATPPNGGPGRFPHGSPYAQGEAQSRVGINHGRIFAGDGMGAATPPNAQTGKQAFLDAIKQQARERR
jgi:hypothetical protein